MMWKNPTSMMMSLVDCMISLKVLPLPIRWRVTQNFNSSGILSSFFVIFNDPHLALPHLSVKDIRSVDWRDLKSRGFQGVVLDKDNTITHPYSNSIHQTLSHSIQLCKSAFGDKVAVLSNSAGLYQYDPEGLEANELEKVMGIRVIRHRSKKPAGSAKDIEMHFGCESSSLVMVGDRVFTDIVYGNKHGFFTILTEPLTVAREPFIVTQVMERHLLNRWTAKGLKPKNHKFWSHPENCTVD